MARIVWFVKLLAWFFDRSQPRPLRPYPDVPDPSASAPRQRPARNGGTPDA